MGSMGFGPLGMFIASCALGAIGGLVLACGSAAKREPPAPPANDAEPSSPQTPRADKDDPLGLVDGATWTFRGTWTRWDEASGRDVSTPLTWTTTILSSEEQADAIAWKITGWPGDAPAADRASATSTLLVPKQGGLVRFEDGAGWIQLPLKDGDQLCPDPEDDVYCWTVEASGTGVDVILRTRPDVTLYHLEPGRGVTHYEYHHNGTTDDVVLDRAD